MAGKNQSNLDVMANQFRLQHFLHLDLGRGVGKEGGNFGLKALGPFFQWLKTLGIFKDWLVSN